MAAVWDISSEEPVKICKWRVKTGSHVNKGSILCDYQTLSTNTLLKYRSKEVGTVLEILAEADQVLRRGEGCIKVQLCLHPIVMKQMCAECGADLRPKTGPVEERAKEKMSASVAMVHSVPELIVSEEQAMELGRADVYRQLKSRKLVLLVDLDQTLLHTTNDTVPPNLKDVYHFQLWHGRGLMWYHTKFRPAIQQFLEAISSLYELHICTFGVRMYAHTIARYLDPHGRYFSHRILSREECFNPSSKTANLKALFPCGDSMVGIIDDREDVWNYAPNLIHVKPYFFFDGTADINAPPGLKKATGELHSHTNRRVTIHRIPKSKQPDRDGGEQPQENNKKDCEPMDTSDRSAENQILEPVQSSPCSSEIEPNEAEDSKTDSGESLQVCCNLQKPIHTDVKRKQPEEDTQDLISSSSVSREQGDADALKSATVQDESGTVTSTSKADETSTEHETCVVATSSENVEAQTAADSTSDTPTSSSESHVTTTSTNQPDTASSSAELCDQVTDSAEVHALLETNASGDGTGKSPDSTTANLSTAKDSATFSVDQAHSSQSIAMSDGVSSESPISPNVSGSREETLSEVDTETIEPCIEEAMDTSCISVSSDCEAKGLVEDGDKELQEDLDEVAKRPPECGAKHESHEVVKELPEEPKHQSEEQGKGVPESESKELSSPKAAVKEGVGEEFEELVEWEDTDDYLFYLEEILTKVHSAFYKMHDEMVNEGSKELPDLKRVIPYVRRKILKGANILFTGVIPIRQPLESSKAYRVATALGARIHTEFIPKQEGSDTEGTTHVVAARLGTSKVNTARKHSGIHVVTPDWLWSCSDRWEWVDERIFPLTEKTSRTEGTDSPDPAKQQRGRKSGANSSANRGGPKNASVSDSGKTSSEANAVATESKESEKSKDEKKESKLNSPLYAFSREDIDNMDKEVDEILDESDSSEDEEVILRKKVLGNIVETSTDEESLSGGEFPHGWELKKKKRKWEDVEAESGVHAEDFEDQNTAVHLVEHGEKVFRFTDDSDSDSDSSDESADDDLAATLLQKFLS